MKTYSIWKFVTCDLTGHKCGDDDFPIHFPVKPNCKNCDVYKSFKLYKMTVEDFRESCDKKLEEDYNGRVSDRMKLV